MRYSLNMSIICKKVMKNTIMRMTETVMQDLRWKTYNRKTGGDTRGRRKHSSMNEIKTTSTEVTVKKLPRR
jgi:hypothetical protein